MIINKNYSKASDIEQIQVDFIEQLIRSVVDTTISDVILKPKKENIDAKWKEAIDKIVKNNEIVRLLKSDVRQKSKYGKSYVGFDIFDDKPIIWVAPYSPRNTSLRLNGMEQFAVRVLREYSTIYNKTPILRNEVTYTDKERFYLFLSGFGVGDAKTTYLDQNQSKKLFKKAKEQELTFPLDYVSLKTPKYILEQNYSGRIKHNLGVLQAMEMLNKDVSDYGDDSYLSDWYPAKEYIPMISEYIKFISWEMNLDHTRIIGMFSQQDLNNINNQANQVAKSNDPSVALQQLLKNYARTNIDDYFNQSTTSGEDSFIKKKLIIRTLGSDGNTVQTQNSNFDGIKHFNGLEALVSLVYKICGYSWNVEQASGTYENISQTQQTLRSVYETTKEKNELFTRQWKQLLIKIFYVLFDKEKTIEQVEKEFNENVDFKIVSNIIMNQNNDWRRTMELKNNGLISNERAIKMIWPELNDSEVKEELKLIKEQETFKETKINDFNAFDNQKPFGSKLENKDFKEVEEIKENE